MRLKLATKISATIAGVLALALLSSLIGLFSAWQIDGVMDSMVAEELPSVRAARELEIALLEQRGIASSYILDGGEASWLQELSRAEPNFMYWLAKAQETTHTDEERQILSRIEEVYRVYDLKHDEVVALHDNGKIEEAKRILLTEVRTLSDQAYDLCEKFIDENERYIASATARGASQIRWMTLLVGGCVLVTVGFGMWLAWLFFSGVILPLRRMADDARHFASASPPSTQEIPEDELRAVGFYLRTLMSDVAETRSHLEQSRTQLISAEKLASVGKIAASVAHEIRNPLTAMKMWLFSIRKSVGKDAEVERKFDIVSEEITRLESIVRNFLEFARPPALKLGQENVSVLLDRTLELLAQRFLAKRIKLVRLGDAELPPVTVDPDQLRQVFINLLNNAVEAMEEANELRISAVVDSARDGRPMVVVRVRDTGAGMPEDVRARVFEPFFTTKEDGTGLGLSIAARIMAHHGGRLVLESSSDEGTTFAVWIPVMQS